MQLGDSEASALARTKAIPVALLVLAVFAVLCCVWLGGGPVALFLPSLAFMLGGVAP